MAREGDGQILTQGYHVRIFDQALRDLKVSMLQAGLKQVQVAKDLNMDVSRLSKVLNGWIRPKPGEFEAIRDYIHAVKEEQKFMESSNKEKTESEV